MNFLQMRERYFHDPEFATIVNYLYSILCEGKLTVAEFRDAATLAGMKFEMENVKPMFFGERKEGE